MIDSFWTFLESQTWRKFSGLTYFGSLNLDRSRSCKFGLSLGKVAFPLCETRIRNQEPLNLLLTAFMCCTYNVRICSSRFPCLSMLWAAIRWHTQPPVIWDSINCRPCFFINSSGVKVSVLYPLPFSVAKSLLLKHGFNQIHLFRVFLV